MGKVLCRQRRDKRSNGQTEQKLYASYIGIFSFFYSFKSSVLPRFVPKAQIGLEKEIKVLREINLYYIPVILLAQIQASHAGEIQHDGKKSVSTHSEIRF